MSSGTVGTFHGSLTNGEGGGGVYTASTQNLTITPFYPTRSDRIEKLGETDLVPNLNVRIFGGTDMNNSVIPMR